MPIDSKPIDLIAPNFPATEKEYQNQGFKLGDLTAKFAQAFWRRATPKLCIEGAYKLDPITLPGSADTLTLQAPEMGSKSRYGAVYEFQNVQVPTEVPEIESDSRRQKGFALLQQLARPPLKAAFGLSRANMSLQSPNMESYTKATLDERMANVPVRPLRAGETVETVPTVGKPVEPTKIVENPNDIAAACSVDGPIAKYLRYDETKAEGADGEFFMDFTVFADGKLHDGIASPACFVSMRRKVDEHGNLVTESYLSRVPEIEDAADEAVLNADGTQKLLTVQRERCVLETIRITRLVGDEYRHMDRPSDAALAASLDDKGASLERRCWLGMQDVVASAFQHKLIMDDHLAQTHLKVCGPMAAALYAKKEDGTRVMDVDHPLHLLLYPRIVDTTFTNLFKVGNLCADDDAVFSGIFAFRNQGLEPISMISRAGNWLGAWFGFEPTRGKETKQRGILEMIDGFGGDFDFRRVDPNFDAAERGMTPAILKALGGNQHTESTAYYALNKGFTNDVIEELYADDAAVNADEQVLGVIGAFAKGAGPSVSKLDGVPDLLPNGDFDGDLTRDGLSEIVARFIHSASYRHEEDGNLPRNYLSSPSMPSRVGVDGSRPSEGTASRKAHLAALTGIIGIAADIDTSGLFLDDAGDRKKGVSENLLSLVRGYDSRFVAFAEEQKERYANNVPNTVVLPSDLELGVWT